MDLREQIARAICGNWVQGDDRPWRVWLEEADAVLEVLRQQEPVGYANGDDLDNMLDDRSAALFTHRDGFRSVPLYLAPGAVAAVPDGWQLVPIEPTPEMVRASDPVDGSEYVSAGKIYRAMLKAAPKPEERR